jgi:hypothetical protein
MLIKKVDETVFADEQKKEHDAFFFDTADRVLADLRSKYPPRDMGILKKYNQSDTKREIEVRDDNYNYVCVKLPEPVVIPRNAKYQNPSLYDKLSLLSEGLKRSNKFVREPYYKLIRGSTTWEQVIEVWPEAAKYQPSKGCVALIAVNPEIKVLVQADSKKREWK